MDQVKDQVKNTSKREILQKDIELKNKAIAKAMEDTRLKKMSFGNMQLVYIGNPNRPEIMKWVEEVIGAALKELGLLERKALIVFSFHAARSRGMTGDAATVGIPMTWDGNPAIVVSMSPETYINGDDRVEGLVHEMHHVRQMLNGDLRVDEEGDNVWKGDKYDDHKSDAQETMMMMARALRLPAIADRIGPPWEVEAYVGGQALAKKIIEEKPWLK